MIKLKNLIKENHECKLCGENICECKSTIKFNLKINLDGEMEGKEDDVLKFKKKIEEEIQDCIDDYDINATWRLD